MSVVFKLQHFKKEGSAKDAAFHSREGSAGLQLQAGQSHNAKNEHDIAIVFAEKLVWLTRRTLWVPT